MLFLHVELGSNGGAWGMPKRVIERGLKFLRCNNQSGLGVRVKGIVRKMNTLKDTLDLERFGPP
jgi:hypothetical protein